MKSLLHRYPGLSIYVKLIPFLLIYLAVAIIFAPSELINDEIRYVMYAKYLLNGIYTPHAPNIDLWSGRGYPAFIAPFIFLKAPLILLRLLNPFLLYFSLIIFYKTVKTYCSEKSAFTYTLLLALYFPVYMNLRDIKTECLTWFLITLIIYLFIKISRQKIFSWKTIFLCGFLIAFLAMTKIIFGYVILLMAILSFALLLLSKFRSMAKRSAYIFSMAFLLCMPYLVYTYTLTHKVFYWTTCSGISLYTMSAPYPKDYGDWKPEEEMINNPNYRTFILSISKLPSFEKDMAYRKQAIENIKTHPAKYLMNCFSNMGRLLFEYPHTNVEQSPGTYFFLGPDLFVFVFMVICFGLIIFRYTKLPDEIALLLFFIVIYLSGSVLVSAYCRMFVITMPFWMLFFAYILENAVFSKLRRLQES
jgi:4-amino-4-deoxy-L-arabinose transferase-like glycosyltransferase